MALVCLACGNPLRAALQPCLACGSRTGVQRDRPSGAPAATERATPASVKRALVGAALTLPATGVLAALAAGLVSGTTALLMLFLIAGGQLGNGTWYVGFAGFYGSYGLLMVAQEIALARRWMAERSEAFEAIGRFFSHFHVG